MASSTFIALNWGVSGVGTETQFRDCAFVLCKQATRRFPFEQDSLFAFCNSIIRVRFLFLIGFFFSTLVGKEHCCFLPSLKTNRPSKGVNGYKIFKVCSTKHINAINYFMNLFLDWFRRSRFYINTRH